MLVVRLADACENHESLRVPYTYFVRYWLAYKWIEDGIYILQLYLQDIICGDGLGEVKTVQLSV